MDFVEGVVIKTHGSKSSLKLTNYVVYNVTWKSISDMLYILLAGLMLVQ